MGVFKSLAGVVQTLVSLFRSTPVKAEPALAITVIVEPEVPVVPVAAPAVAGYVYREPGIDFHLPARLASVARLNTPDGRKAMGQRSRFAALPPMPASRIGAKRTRTDAGKGTRVLRTSATTRKSGVIIPFPLEKCRAPTIEQVAEAA